MTLALVPLVDARAGGPVRHAELQRETALALREACVSFLPRALRPLAPAADRVARIWLERSDSPYVEEIAQIAAFLGASGLYAINACYELGCTAQIKDGRLRRTLDWPFSGLGYYVQVAVQQGAAGVFHNVTWPGFVGVLTATAPGRFSAALNQAPLHRRTRGEILRPFDHLRHGWTTWSRVRHIPPAHLLRRVFETAPDFAAASALLTQTPIARPALFTLAGTRPDQVRLIERTETQAVVYDGPASVANDWRRPHPDWEPRAAAWIRDKRADDSARRAAMESAEDDPERFGITSPPLVPCGAQPPPNLPLSGGGTVYGELGLFPPPERGRVREGVAGPEREMSQNALNFNWLAPPILNADTRVAVEMDAGTGRLAVLGLERGERASQGVFALIERATP